MGCGPSHTVRPRSMAMPRSQPFGRLRRSGHERLVQALRLNGDRMRGLIRTVQPLRSLPFPLSVSPLYDAPSV